MTNRTTKPWVELDDDALDGVSGGKGTGILSGNLGLGPVSVGVTVDLKTGETYVTGGLSPSLSVGGSVSVGVVIPYNADTPASDVITGWGAGGEAYFGGGGGVSANGSGVIISGGFGLSIGGGVSMTGSTAPDHSSPTVEVPVYDAMGNATGYTETVANPAYHPDDTATNGATGNDITGDMGGAGGATEDHGSAGSDIPGDMGGSGSGGGDMGGTGGADITGDMGGSGSGGDTGGGGGGGGDIPGDMGGGGGGDMGGGGGGDMGGGGGGGGD